MSSKIRLLKVTPFWLIKRSGVALVVMSITSNLMLEKSIAIIFTSFLDHHQGR